MKGQKLATLTLTLLYPWHKPMGFFKPLPYPIDCTHGVVWVALLVTINSVLHGQTMIKHDINEREIWQNIGDRGKGREFAQWVASEASVRLDQIFRMYSSIYKKSQWLSLLLQHTNSCQYNLFYDFLLPKVVSTGTTNYSV